MYVSGAEKELEELLRMMRMYRDSTVSPGITSSFLFDNIRSYTNDSKSISDSVKGLYGTDGANHIDGYNFSNKSIMNSYGKGDVMSVYGTDGANHIDGYMNISNKALLKGLYNETGANYRSDKSGKSSSRLGSGGKSGGGKTSSSGKGSSSSSSSSGSSGGGK
ncbi:hypothetical protein KY332_01710 [Candidatus Woesearchaeota archaeon]|nr:hypothetical protein [Candidatus Woesearchaeota archaeon]